MMLSDLQTGHQNQYIIAYEDAYGYATGVCELLTSEEVLQKFGINLNDIELREKYPANVEGSNEFNQLNK